MNGKLVGGGIVGAALLAGAALYYLQVYHFYEPAQIDTIRLTASGTGAAEPIPAEDLRAIDARSSPIRFRACFRTAADPDTLAARFAPYPAAEPLTAPGWFDCFDAAEIGAALADGSAQAFLGERGVATGVDRVVAILADGRGFAWHQLQPDFGD